MDEPVHARESRFWDQVADWVLESRAPAVDFTEADLEAMLRELRDDLDDLDDLS